MIGYLEGTIQKKIGNNIIVKCSGTGYLVHVTKNLLAETEENEPVALYIHTAVSEDDIRLFGFQEIESLNMFKLLITVSGVGPKTALEIMNNPLSSLKYAISSGDSSLLVKTKGIGKKTAERIIIDLKGKVINEDKPSDYECYKDIDSDAILALQNLGFRKHQIVQKIQLMPKNITKTEDIIRHFLQNA
ncbi:Holliday junction branch migration protein RuvA [Candidatus Peregrinibacteria bacterium]|nr:Holliday junction branch migration protein RuvA [Candidatus Peregrinibacteria bacterium]